MMNNYEIDETAWKKNFSDTLQRLMGKRNISINKLAAEILVDPKSIRNYIDKKSVPSAICLLYTSNTNPYDKTPRKGKGGFAAVIGI